MVVINFYFYLRAVIVMRSTVEEGGERLGGKGNWMILATLTLFLVHEPV